MTARFAALRTGQALPLGLVHELLDRQRTLALFGFALLLAVLPMTSLHLIDPRRIDGMGLWVKPIKFLISIGIFSLTVAWFFGFVRPERRDAMTMRATVATLVAMGSFEIVWIGWQASQGLASHFNNDTPFFAIMYGLMGLSAVLLVGTTLPLAVEIARRPAPGLRPDFVAAVVVGLVLTFVLGGGLGGYMSAQPGHSVGAEGNRLPLVGWNRGGGDLRVAHFLGIHAQQAIPVLAVLVSPLATVLRWGILAVGTIFYITLTLIVFAQAVAGRALIPA